MSETQCYCGSGETLVDCCKKVQGNGAATPEELMRSRFSAYVESDVDYLLKTTHADGIEPNMRVELDYACATNRWIFLRVVDTPRPSRNEGVVEFVAYCQQGDEIGELHERSKFKKVNDSWVYHSGDVLPHYKIGVNEVCWCGSGKKLKKCHRQQCGK